MTLRRLPYFIFAMIILSQPVISLAEEPQVQQEILRFEQVYPPLEDYSEAAHEKRLEYIKMAKEMVRNPSCGPEGSAPIKLRLAELYSEEAHYHHFQETRDYKRKYESCVENNPKDCNPSDIQLDHSESEERHRKAIGIYGHIQSGYPKFLHLDEVIFQLGLELQEVGQQEDAQDQFLRLINTYPDSEYIPHVYIQFGEVHFKNGRMKEAVVMYQMAAYENSPHYDFALYKLAWCYYNLGTIEQAIENMAIIAHSEHKLLQNQANKDLVYFSLVNTE